MIYKIIEHIDISEILIIIFILLLKNICVNITVNL